METKETKEFLVGLNHLVVLLVRRLKDGVDLSDAFAVGSALVSDPAFKSAIEGIQNVPAELKDISLDEAFDLIKLEKSAVEEIISELKK